ncbi:hypothetical protein OSB04_017671 [Centaurea solstitialis]|uniref:Phospholipid scramblase n=1 Tax=Centaurea solstitialis TaxID=347529 RepID=A0AA38WM82_9ASTR|nr:hypothetical protein OSB04_017671 [Centaurea solstitialis]
MDSGTSKKIEGGMSVTYQCPILDSTNYTIWAVKIKAPFNVYGIWEALEPKGDVDINKNTMAIAYLFQALPEQLVLQVAHHTNASDIWEDLKARFVGADRVKEARLQTLESEFESLKMKDSESLDEFTGKISQLVSQANNLGSTIENKRLVRKLLGSVPARFIQIVAAIEQFADLNTIKSNQDIKGRGRGRNWKAWRNKDGNRHQQDKSEIKCFKCNKFGHFKYECPKKEEEVNLAQYKDDDLIGFICEQSNGVFRTLLPSRRPLVATIFDLIDQKEVFRVRRPFWWITSSIYAEVGGKEIGVVHRRWHLWRRIYDLYLGDEQFAVVENPGFFNRMFTLKGIHGEILAEIERVWRVNGVYGLEVLGAGQYVIRFDHYHIPRLFEQVQARTLTLSERAVTVALLVSLDNDFFSPHGRGW